MADTKGSALPAMTTPTDDDLIIAVNNPAGVPATQASTFANAWANYFKGKADALYVPLGSGGFTQIAAFIPASGVGGTADAITLTYAGGPTLGDGQVFIFLPKAANTGAVTINYNAGGAIALINYDGSALTANALTTAQPVVIYRDVAGATYRLITGTTAQIVSDLTALISTFTGMPQNSQSANYTLVLGDAGKHILHPSSDAIARTFTIPANASVAFPIGTVIGIVNESTAAVTLAITTDTLEWDASTGSRTLAQNSVSSLLKIGTTTWRLSGSGIT